MSDDKSTQENMWQPVSTMPDGAEALTRIKDASGERNVQRLRKQGRLFFTGDMCVYYTPTHWRPE